MNSCIWAQYSLNSACKLDSTCHDPEKVVSHLINMLHGGFIFTVVLGEERVESWVGDEGAVVEGIEVIIVGTHCYWRTSLALLKLALTLWCCRICVLYVFPPWGSYLSWVSVWYCALEPPDLYAKYSSCEYLCKYFIVVTRTFFCWLQFWWLLYLLTFSPCTLIREFNKI